MARTVIILGILFGILFVALKLLQVFLHAHPWAALPALLLFG